MIQFVKVHLIPKNPTQPKTGIITKTEEMCWMVQA